MDSSSFHLCCLMDSSSFRYPRTDYDGGTTMVAEARVCMGKSQHHSFPCISDRLCSNECVKEDGGWTAGYCHLRYCRCQKAC